MIQQPLPKPPIISEDALQYVTNKWSRHAVQPFLIALLTTGLLTAVTLLFFLFTDDSNWLLMPILSFLITLEGIYTTLWLNHAEQRITDRFAYRAAELLIIILATRLFTWFISGNFPDWRLFKLYLRTPLILFADGLFLAGSLLIALAWERGLTVARIFATLSIDSGEADYYLTPKRDRVDDKRPFQHNRIHIITQLFKQWIIGGVILAGFAALSTYDLQQATTVTNFFAMGRLGLHPTMLTALLLYFLAGFLLLSQARLAAANARWLREGAIKSNRVEKIWHRSSRRLLLLIAFFTALLPIGSTNGIGRILQTAIGVTTSIFSLLYLLFIGLIAMLLPQATPATSTPPPPLPTAPPPQFTPAPPVPPNETAELFFSSAFWAIAIVFSIAAVLFFLRERGIRFNSTTAKRGWQWLVNLFKTVWQSMAQQTAEIRHAMLSRLQLEDENEENGGGKRPFRFIRVNGLPPREQIRYFYLSTVRRAAEKGIKRRQDATPIEFSETLKEQFPDAEQDVETLTDAFLHARYSPQPVKKEALSPIKKRWRHMRSNLRRHRKQ